MSLALLAEHTARLVRDLPHQDHVVTRQDTATGTIVVEVSKYAPADEVCEILAHLTDSFDADRTVMSDHGRLITARFEGTCVLVTTGFRMTVVAT